MYYLSTYGRCVSKICISIIFLYHILSAIFSQTQRTIHSLFTNRISIDLHLKSDPLKFCIRIHFTDLHFQIF